MTGSLRILHLFASPYWSGPAENIALLALAQRGLGHSVTVAVDRKRMSAPAEELIAPRLERLGLLDDQGLELSVKSSPGAWLRDLRQLHARSVDVVHAHFTHDHFLARFGRPRGSRLVRSIHAPRSLRRSLPRADALTVPTEALLEGLRVPALVLPALVGPEFRPPADRPAHRQLLGIRGDPVVGMVSTFQPSRRHALGIDAFAVFRRSHPDAQMILVGDGALESQLKAQVAQMGLTSSVTFAGYHSGAEFIRWCQALDQVWVLGLGNDFSARAAAQARACGVRVVAVDEGALSSWADALCSSDIESVCAGANGIEHRPVRIRSHQDVAADIVELYLKLF